MLISDIEKGQFIETTIRGGISKICKGYTEINNNFLKWYDAAKPTSCIIYLDANKLYWHSMMQRLPTKILDWVKPKDFNLDNDSSDSLIGCFLELHLDYPDYPLAGEKYKWEKKCCLNINYKSQEIIIFLLVKTIFLI